MSVDISVSITEDVVDIIATPTVNIVNVTNSASIDPGLYDLSEFTNTSLNPFVRTSGLSSYVPTSRTLTINGTTQDLSANRTFTIPTDLTVGTTPIASGTIGRVLFQGTGNVLQQSSNLFWDNTNQMFQVGTSSTSPFGSPLIFMGKDQNAETNFQISNSTNGTAAVVGFRVFGANNRSTFLGEFSQGHTGVSEYASHYVIEPNAAGVKHGLIISIPETTTGSDLMVYTGGRNLANRKLTLFGGTGNIAINTTTDSGFKLDVNGSARFTGQTTYVTAMNFGGNTDQINPSSNSGNFDFLSNLPIRFLLKSGSVERMRIVSSTGNVLINTTTDAGFRLDVNGTARVSGRLEIQNSSGLNIRTTVGAVSTSFRPSGNDAELRTNDASVACAYFYQNGNVGFSQRVVFGSTTLNASAQLQIDSTTRGFLPPRMTTTQKNAIASPATGLQVYDTTLNRPCFYDGTSWITL